MIFLQWPVGTIFRLVARECWRANTYVTVRWVTLSVAETIFSAATPSKVDLDKKWQYELNANWW